MMELSDTLLSVRFMPSDRSTLSVIETLYLPSVSENHAHLGTHTHSEWNSVPLFYEWDSCPVTNSHWDSVQFFSESDFSRVKPSQSQWVRISTSLLWVRLTSSERFILLVSETLHCTSLGEFHTPWEFHTYSKWDSILPFSGWDSCPVRGSHSWRGRLSTILWVTLLPSEGVTLLMRETQYQCFLSDINVLWKSHAHGEWNSVLPFYECDSCTIRGSCLQ